jgi:YidC/Oxa1 family membrane protein insertase
MELMQPKPVDGQPQQNNLVLKLLPLMIGWFSLNVPAALCVYWVTNNILTTAASLYIRSTLKTPEPITSGPPPRERTASTIFSPPPPKPAGFGERFASASTAAPERVVSPYAGTDIKPITAVDAEIVAPTPVVDAVVSNDEKVVTVSEASEPAVTSEVKSGTPIGSSDQASAPKKRVKKRRKKSA